MTNGHHALLLIGSPKPKKSVSRSLGDYLLAQWMAHRCTGETLHISTALKTGVGWKELLAALQRADLLVLAFPIYVDAPPSSVIEAFERLAGHRDTIDFGLRPRLVAITNCGYPEAQHTDLALRICRQFAREAGFQWAGGLGLGGGPTLRAQPLDTLGAMARNVRSALEITAHALAEGREVPEEAYEQMRVPLLPHSLYRLMVSLNWYSAARRNKVMLRLHDRP